MYIWTGLVFDKKTEYEIRKICQQINEEFQISEQSFTLPQHISLKTSFNVLNYKEVIEYLKMILKDYESIDVELTGITKLNGVIWIDVEENEKLTKIHDDLNKKLLEKFSIPLIKFDGENFIFHSTLFQDSQNNEKLEEIYKLLKKVLVFPLKLKFNEIDFGISKEGTVGTYNVYDKIIMNGGMKNDNR